MDHTFSSNIYDNCCDKKDVLYKEIHNQISKQNLYTTDHATSLSSNILTY